MGIGTEKPPIMGGHVKSKNPVKKGNTKIVRKGNPQAGVKIKTTGAKRGKKGSGY